MTETNGNLFIGSDGNTNTGVEHGFEIEGCNFQGHIHLDDSRAGAGAHTAYLSLKGVNMQDNTASGYCIKIKSDADSIFRITDFHYSGNFVVKNSS